MFAFLEALRRNVDLGPLEHLYRLGLTKTRCKLWPTLCLSGSILDSEDCLSYEVVTKYYRDVQVENAWQNTEWFKAHLNPTAEIECVLTDLPETMDALDQWTKLNITSLFVSLERSIPFAWTTILHRLPHLTILEVCDDSTNFGTLFEFVAESNQIKELLFSSTGYKMTSSDLRHLIQWFRKNQPGRSFDCTVINWEEIDYDMRQEFYEAMFNCPTLDRLVLSSCYLDDMDFSELTFPMESLQLGSCLEFSELVESLAGQLEGSMVTKLALNSYCDEDTDGLEYLVEVLPRTSVTHLKLTNLLIDDSPSWSNLALKFDDCRLKSLTLHSDNFPSSFAQSLATAIQNNETICELDLCGVILRLKTCKS
ncbi:hypothetical protein AeRB84_002526 [Aphanomyces euteiches]|nr:hypothetical protein AeRB84_002526 [Aphanomyces euteiches]